MRYSFEVSACALACAAIAVGCTIALHLYRMRRGRRFRPGPRSRWYAFLSPLRWFILSRCGCNLSGLPISASNSLTCTECGRQSALHHPNTISPIRSTTTSASCNFSRGYVWHTPTTRMPALFPARIPVGVSSIARHAPGSTPSIFAASR